MSRIKTPEYTRAGSRTLWLAAALGALSGCGPSADDPIVCPANSQNMPTWSEIYLASATGCAGSKFSPEKCHRWAVEHANLAECCRGSRAVVPGCEVSR
jgi:hypothetical protein